MSRRDIYYWKCDRPAAFHGNKVRSEIDENELLAALRGSFQTNAIRLANGSGQGNHLTWNAVIDGQEAFIRVENGPERDGQMAVESQILEKVREAGVVTPRVLGCDATRSKVAFAWQALELIHAPDLNHWFKQGLLDTHAVAKQIGESVACWQSISPDGFGVLDTGWRGYRSTYADYFHLQLDRHLDFLVKQHFLTQHRCDEVMREVSLHDTLLRFERGCLVHKDLALWNVLGTEKAVAAYIDFDDAVSGDEMDDLSLLACFQDAAFLQCAMAGYENIKPLPSEYQRRFWLHLLRNMIVKAVIRVGAGYFERDDSFFLIGAGSSGGGLRQFTMDRLMLALKNLREDAPVSALDAL
jgi:fructosamine-3-kinase